MSVLIFAIIVLIIAAALIYAVAYLPIDANLAGIIKFLIVVLAVVAIAQRAGILA